MKIYIVAKMTDREDAQESITVSAHVDKLKADVAAQAIDHQGREGVYGVVEEIELDLTGAAVSQLQELAAAAKSMGSADLAKDLVGAGASITQAHALAPLLALAGWVRH